MRNMDEIRGALNRYVEKGYSPGGCLEHALSNDLMGFVGSADPHTLAATLDICMEITKLPYNSRGNRVKVENWMKDTCKDEFPFLEQ